MTPGATRLGSTPGILLTVGLLSFGVPPPARAQGPRRSQEPPPPPPKNLQVLPKDMSREDVVKIMATFTNALGVPCSHCHIDDVPGRENDFASDDVPAKTVARAMLKMVADLNRTLPAAVDKPDAVQVQCATCHRGVATPKQLNEILTDTTAEKGVAGAIEEYKTLRQKYYGGQSYDFSEGNLVFYANQLTQANKPDAAIAFLQLNLEYYPSSARTYVSMGNAWRRKGDREAAIRQYRKALALDPNNAGAKRALAQLKSEP